ncbi:MAG: LysR family transcriptional regulator [Polyangiaceae bacterium]
MDRVRRMYTLWNWLPAFRAVGERTHLPTAAKDLGISPSALSRAVALLEEEVGEPMFDRVGRRLELNERGRTFLRSVRSAMRLIDEGIDDVRAESLRGGVHIAAREAFSWLALDAAELLAAEHPDLVLHVASVGAANAAPQLRAGQLDIALVSTPASDEDLVAEQLLENEFGVYCSEAHPLAQHGSVSLEQLAEHGFIGPTTRTRDLWPPGVPRKITLRVECIHDAVQASKTGKYLLFLPHWAGRRAQLVQLEAPIAERAPVYMMFRRPLAAHPRTDTVLAALRKAAQAARARAE